MSKVTWPAMVFVLAALACGAPQQAPATGVGSETPRYGGSLNATISSDPADWDLTYGGRSRPNAEGLALAYNSLIGFKAGPDVAVTDLILRPELAERWEVSPDARTFTFHLRKGVKFANMAPVHGRELTSADVKWTFEYVSRTGWAKDKKLPTGQFSWMFEGLDRIDTPDPYAAIVRFAEPFAPFLSYAASDYNPVMPREIYEQDGHLKDRLVGTGAFQLDMASTQKGSRWVFKKNPTYWEEGRPYIDEVRALVLPEDATVMAAYQTKQVDVLAANIGAQQADEIRKAVPNTAGVEYLRPSPMHLYMNTRKKPLGDARIRKAIALAVDPDEFNKVLFNGKGGVALAGAFQDTYSQEEIRKILRKDLDEARRLVREAGFPNGVDIEFIYPGKAYGDAYITSMELLQSQLRKAGVNLVLRSQEKQVESDNKKTGNFAMTHTNKAVEGDVDSYLSIFLPDSRSNYGGINDPRLTEMVIAQRREGDTTKRRELVRMAVRYIYDNAYALALYYGISFEFWHPYLKHYMPQTENTGWPVTHSWLDK